MRTPLVTLALLVGLDAPATAEIVGRRRAVDGDTIVVGRLTLRSFGIDAPEADQPCGATEGAVLGVRRGRP